MNPTNHFDLRLHQNFHLHHDLYLDRRPTDCRPDDLTEDRGEHFSLGAWSRLVRAGQRDAEDAFSVTVFPPLVQGQTRHHQQKGLYVYDEYPDGRVDAEASKHRYALGKREPVALRPNGSEKVCLLHSFSRLKKKK